MAPKAFSLFDEDGNGGIFEHEVEEKKDLTKGFALDVEALDLSGLKHTVYKAKDLEIGVDVAKDGASETVFQKIPSTSLLQEPFDYAALEKKLMATMQIPPEFIDPSYLADNPPTVIESTPHGLPSMFEKVGVTSAPLSMKQLQEIKAGFQKTMQGVKDAWYTPVVTAVQQDPVEHAIQQTVNAKVQQKLTELTGKLFIVDLNAMSSAERTEFFQTWGKFQAVPPLYGVAPAPPPMPKFICLDCGAKFTHEATYTTHPNLCLKWQCVDCGVQFATLPYPNAKKFGSHPLCAACKSAAKAHAKAACGWPQKKAP